MRARMLVLAAALVLAGCAGDLSSRAAGDLRDHVRAVRDSAEALDPEAASAGLEELRGVVERWLQDGELGPGRAEEILAAADDVEAALALLLPPVEEPPPTPTPEVEATVEEDEDDDDEDDDDDDEDDDEDEDDEDGDSSGPGGGDSSGPG